MTLNEEIQLTITKALDCKKLFLIFILIKLPLISILQFKSVSMPLVALLFLITYPLQLFLGAGFHGITFMKIKSQKIEIKDFFRLACKCFWAFVITSIIIGVIIGIPNWLLSKLLLFLISEQYQIKAMGYYFSLIRPIYLLFVFAFPLVIIEYFSQSKLRPVKTSIFLVVKKASKIKLIYIIIGIKFALSLLMALIIDNPIEDNSYLFTSVIDWPLSFLLIIYSYMRLSDCFYKDMNFDFERHNHE